MNDAILLIKDKFATFTGCELHSIRYAGDEANNEENLEWLNSLREARSNIPPEDVGKQYVQVAEFLSDFHSPVEDGDYAWNQDMEYTDYQWWLGRLEDGRWEIVSWGYYKETSHDRWQIPPPVCANFLRKYFPHIISRMHNHGG